MAPTSGTTAGITWRSPLGARRRTRGLFTAWPAACQRKTDSTVSRARDMGRSRATSASVRSRIRPISASPRETGRYAQTNGAVKAAQIPPFELFPLCLRASFLQEHPRSFKVPVREMLEPDGHLDKPLERLARGTLRPQPVRLQELVHLEEQPRVEEIARLVQRLREPRLGRRRRPCAHDVPGPQRPLAELIPEAAGLPAKRPRGIR